MARTDVHRPSVIKPEDYHFVAFECIKTEGMGDIHAIMENRRMIQEHMGRTGGKYSTHAHGGNCHICGNANAIFTVLFHHVPTNTYIRCGQECADKLDCGDVSEFRRTVNSALERKAGKAKAESFLGKAGLLQAWEIWNDNDAPHCFEENTIRDIVGKLIKYGDISQKQIDFVWRLLEKINARVAIEADRKAEADKAAPVPVTDKRMTVKGTIIAIKTVDSNFGSVVKMLIQHDDGWKVWGSVPVFLDDNGQDEYADRGAIVQFDARISINGDPKFGFFSRPTKGKIITPASE